MRWFLRWRERKNNNNKKKRRRGKKEGSSFRVWKEYIMPVNLVFIFVFESNSICILLLINAVSILWFNAHKKKNYKEQDKKKKKKTIKMPLISFWFLLVLFYESLFCLFASIASYDTFFIILFLSLLIILDRFYFINHHNFSVFIFYVFQNVDKDAKYVPLIVNH